MKQILVLLISIVAMAISCTGVKTVSGGLENESFINIVGIPKNYIGGVDVNIDDKISFKAEVNKDYSDRPKGKVYSISTGTHVVSVSYNDKLLFKQQIFMSAQETKKIVLQ